MIATKPTRLFVLHSVGLVRHPLLFPNCVRVLLRPTVFNMNSCGMGPTVYHPYPRRVESLTICRHHYYKSSTFSPIILRP